MNEKRETLKLRIAMLLSLFAVVCYYYSIVDLATMMRSIATATVTALLIVVLIVKSRLVYKPIAKGLGGIAAGVSIIFWKEIHSYSVKLEMTIAFFFVILLLILSFKYSEAELEQRVTKQNTGERPTEK